MERFRLEAFDNAMSRKEATRSLLIAALATVALYFIPYAGFVTYPVRILVTFIHEGGHALATLLTGGLVRSISISPDGSGVTQSLGGIVPILASAGYLGATLYGALLLALLRRGVPARRLLAITAGAIGLMIPATVLGGPFGMVWAIALTLALALAARRLSAAAANFVVGFVGVQCVLNALFDLRTLFFLSTSTSAATDARNMQTMTGVPAVVWASLWIVVALGILWSALIRPALKAAR